MQSCTNRANQYGYTAIGTYQDITLTNCNCISSYAVANMGYFTTETIDDAIFFVKFFINSWLLIKSKYLTTNLIQPKTTLGFMWDNLGKTLSTIISAYSCDFGSYLQR